MPFMTSQTSSISIPHTKEAMQKDALALLRMWDWDTANLFGRSATGITPGTFDEGDEQEVRLYQATPGWRQFDDLYEYAVNGVLTEAGDPPQYSEFYDTFQTDMSLINKYRTLFKTYALADARAALDGRPREVNADGVPAGYLSVAEIAMLANMDERSVRNAMNPKLPNRLIGEQIGKRTFIYIMEARRWLVGRKGYQPTKTFTQKNIDESVQLAISKSLANRLEKVSEALGLSVQAFLQQQIDQLNGESS